jgi:hypothetical protein
MSHKTFSRILNDQSNKLLLGGNPLTASNPVMEPVINNVVENNIIQPEQIISNSKYYNIFGYELSIFTIIIILILTFCVIYLLYKYFFTKTDIVNIKKYSDINLSKKGKNVIEKEKEKDKNKEQESTSENNSLNSSKNSELSSSNKTNNS